MDAASTVVSREDPGDATGRGVAPGRRRKFVRELSLAVAIYGMAGWIYVALSAIIVPRTLSLPLTHLLPHVREDTSGVASFILSFLAFISYRLSRTP